MNLSVTEKHDLQRCEPKERAGVNTDPFNLNITFKETFHERDVLVCQQREEADKGGKRLKEKRLDGE